MKFQRIIEQITAKPWLITPAAHASIQKLVENHLAGVALDLTDMMPQTEPARIENGVGIVPIQGVIGKGLSKMEKSCGAVGIEDISQTLSSFANDPECLAIVLDVDSPGGSVAGVPELAEQISELADLMPVIAFTDGQMDSAAYWLASGASAIYASPSAEVGSIGVYLPWVDSTAAYAAAGLKVEVFKNDGATYKAMGLPGTALTDEQKAHLKERVNQIFGMFANAINAKRTVGSSAMQGQTFMGESAKAAGLIDSVADFHAAVRDARAMVG